MSARVIIYSVRGNGRSRKLAPSLVDGAKRAGYQVEKVFSDDYDGPTGDVACWYAYEKNMPKVMDDYLSANKPVVFIDLGYWGRARKSRIWGYHKVAVNGRHPGNYLMERNLPAHRFRMFGLKIRPWRQNGNHILLAGMSGRAAQSIGYRPEEWESKAVKELKKYTDRTIIYRPKPTWVGSGHLKGTTRNTHPSLDSVLADCHAVVTHHSNVAIDGLIQGIPAFAFDGAATHVTLQDLSRIENPIMPANREQWLTNLAWCQFNITEMFNGLMWRHLKSVDLIP